MEHQFYVYPYKRGSRSATALKESLGATLIKTTDSRFLGTRSSQIVINWGSSSMPNYSRAKVLNNPIRVNVAKNKLDTFNTLLNKGVKIPKFTTDRTEAITYRGDDVICRLLLEAYGGIGVHVLPKDTLACLSDDYKMYVEYIKKTFECRVHVVLGKPILIQMKLGRTMSGVVRDWRIRNYQNGWVFTSNLPDGFTAEIKTMVKSLGVEAVDALGLDFGAVDIAYNRYRGAYVLEVNTACGLDANTTIDAYVNAFNEYKEGL